MYFTHKHLAYFKLKCLPKELLFEYLHLVIFIHSLFFLVQIPWSNWEGVLWNPKVALSYLNTSVYLELVEISLAPGHCASGVTHPGQGRAWRWDLQM